MKTKRLSEHNREQIFRWIRESVSLMYAHHKHPLCMVAMIFMYMEAFGKTFHPTGSSSEKVAAFVRRYMHDLTYQITTSFGGFDSDPFNGSKSCTSIKRILGDYYRNGLVHQFFMKEGMGIHENILSAEYILLLKKERVFSLNIDRLVPDFLKAINQFNRDLDKQPIREKFRKALFES